METLTDILGRIPRGQGAELLGITPSFVSMIRHQRSVVSARLLARASARLGLSGEQVLATLKTMFSEEFAAARVAAAVAGDLSPIELSDDEFALYVAQLEQRRTSASLQPSAGPANESLDSPISQAA